MTHLEISRKGTNGIGAKSERTKYEIVSRSFGFFLGNFDLFIR
jgi:hypothetical protein